ncbi:hypothetical protein MTBBW1_550012 [Desulfamplus magnetovallimortis]|uniref:Uncharacterized protein n=1 Tax=Desulfamplus magnetovallimortis TaxID=1246637 RepID=A0A1W1HI48_9BACT|nr:hypothetical protein [Desulfamplus magnetovallimortis]SLM32062.1 hypothetical protein MTBBW1_550012 [Desulfamplus magnetovallimortis]
MEFSLHTPEEISQTLAARVKQLHLMKRWKRETLSQRSGVTLASLKRFGRVEKSPWRTF